jgi:hypothetical protein
VGAIRRSFADEQWLEFRVKPSNAQVPFVTLLPRQRIMYVPFAVTAVNALSLGGISSAQFVKTDDVRLSDARNPIPGSTNYIQNTANSQSGGFNLNGTGTANVFNAVSQFNINGNRILSGGNDSIFAGFGAGQSNTTGSSNAFFGAQAGAGNLTGNFNSFFGKFAGFSNTGGGANSFFGASSGQNNSTGGNNAFFGDSSGFSNFTGSGNTMIGVGANVTLNNLTNATAIGFRAAVGQNNSLVLGGISGINNSLVDTNVGIGTIAPTSRLTVVGGGAGNNLLVADSNNVATTIDLSNTSTGGRFWRQQSLGSGIAGRAGNFELVDVGAGTVRFAITPTGNIGINTTTPAARFTVIGGGAGNNLLVADNDAIAATIDLSNTSLGGIKWRFQSIGSGVTGRVGNLEFVNVNAGSVVFAVTPNGNIGIGTAVPSQKLQVAGGLTVNGPLNYFSTSGNANFFMKGEGAANGINFGVVGNAGSNSTLFVSQYDGTTYQDRFIIDLNGNAVFPNNSVFVPNGTINVGNSSSGLSTRLNVNGFITLSLPGGGTDALCRNGSLQISFCSSSIRYKQNIQNYDSGLEIIKRLRPVTFNWKVNNEADFGLVAEETAEVEPLLTFKNEKGEVEGVKYNRVGVVLINAVKEQQTEIEAQQKQIDEQKIQIEAQQRQTDSQAELIRQQREKLDKQQSEIEALRRVVCSINPAAKICREEKP